jgi:ApaG protein
MVSEVVTNRIRVNVKALFLPEHSDPPNSIYVYAYRIRITNEGDAPAQLMRRHWIITDGLGHVEEVEGEGVVGEQPRLAPGESFEYTSTCPLNTQYGIMRGRYQMVDDQGNRFEAEVSPFKLFIPALSN